MNRLVEVVAPARLGRSFRWLLSSSWVSNLGDGLVLAAGPLLVASQTHDPFLVALAVVLQRLPWLLFGLIAGVVADRFDRRRIIVTVQLARAAIVTALSATILLGQINTTLVLVAMFLLGTAETFVDITGTTLLPMIVDKRDLAVGNARLLAGTITINQLAGPPVGAALFAAHAAAPFLLQVTCLLVSAFTAARVALPAHGVKRGGRSHVRKDIADGVKWLWRNAAVRTLVITIVTFNITYGAAWSVLVLYAIERLHTGEVGFGLLTTALAVGGLLGTGIYGRLTSRVSLGNIMRAGLIIETLTHLALALTTIPTVALLIMFVFGAHAFVWNTTSTTVRQRAVPIELQGRVSSVYLIGVHGGIVAGSVIGGAIAGAWGVVAPFWFAFIGSALLVALIWRQLAHIAHADADDGLDAALPRKLRRHSPALPPTCASRKPSLRYRAAGSLRRTARASARRCRATARHPSGSTRDRHRSWRGCTRPDRRSCRWPGAVRRAAWLQPPPTDVGRPDAAAGPEPSPATARHQARRCCPAPRL